MASYVLTPQFAGAHVAGSGADASFYRIDNTWQGSTVLWNESTRSFGSGDPISSFVWGTGLWGQADWRTVQQTGAGAAPANAPSIQQAWQGQVGNINQANSRYNECYGGTWGTAALVPFFSAAPALGDCGNAEAADPAQQNWTARYSGYIRIAEAGEYNFSVLHDDGFFFRLIGAGGTELDIGRDYLNPRDRIGFDQNLWLSEGLYGFELGAWNRLGAGVVDLRWTTGCSQACEWTLVPTENLLSASAVPEPGAFALALTALAALSTAGAVRVRRRRPTAKAPTPLLRP